ncbi:hypothetical protein BG006_003870 [Podila minutissima]|uniref:Uncharacterized protein n=1 Tax=Podila minutissima TaxID=64525 RepID=A0A9P5VN12_9FUNG|nr:hypothetical protein BG006_003870 [Podila minutissima]
MANSNRDSSRIHDAPHHQKHVHASVEEDEDDGWQVVSSSKDSPSSSKTSSSSSPSTEDDHPITTITDIAVPEASVAPTDATTEFKEKPPKAKKKIFGTDEFQPVVSKKQIARANKLAGVQRPNASVGISTSSYFDLLQNTEGTENVEEIVDRIREEEEEKARLLLEELELEQEQEQEKTAADIKKILEEEDAKKEAEIRSQQALEQRQRQLEEEEEAKEQLLQQIAQHELERAKEEEEKLAAAAVEAEQKKQKEDKKQQQKKEKREKELKEKEAAAAAAAAAAAVVVAAAERAQKEEEEAQALAKDTHENEDTTEEPTEIPTVDTIATPEDDSWEIEEDDEWQQQSKSKKGRKTRGTQPGESSVSIVSDLHTKMPIYLLEQDEIQQDSEEEEEVSEEEQQRRDEEKAKAAAKAKAKAASNKKNKKKNNSNSNSVVSSPRMEGRKKNVSSNSSTVNSPRLEGKKSKKASATPVATTVEEPSEATSKLTNRGIKSLVVEEESKPQEKEVAEVQATETEEGSTSMVSKDGSAGMVGGTLNSIFEKGVNPGLIKMLNLVFVALFLSLGFLIFASGGNLHVIALTGIAVALFVTIQWFLREMETMKIDERKNA